MIRNRKKNNLIMMLVILIGSIGIGYAFLTQDLTINGIGKIKASRWDIYFNNLILNPENVTLVEGDSDAVIDTDTRTDVNFTVSFHKPGDFYEFTVDVVNDGSIDAMVDTMTYRYNGEVVSETNPLPEYFRYTVTYDNGDTILAKDILYHESIETIKVRLEIRRDIDASVLPDSITSSTFNFGIQYIQAGNDTDDRRYTPLTTFGTDSWETILKNLRYGKTYEVGSLKEVNLGNELGTHTLRVANNTTPSECEREDFSETACGFVLEFVDILLTKEMNGVNSNAGGWENSSLRSYLNSTEDSTSLYNSLPSALKNEIISTKVISGHGSTNDESDFITSDKIYLLSTHEVWKDVDNDLNNGIDFNDTAYQSTRQLDYYQNLNVSTTNYSSAIKQYNGVDNAWWLRSSKSNNTIQYFNVKSDGSFESLDSSSLIGVSPAFRLKGPAQQYEIRYIINNANAGERMPSSANKYEVVAIDSPSKSFTLSFDENNQGATLSSNETVHKDIAFEGWTAKNLDTVRARYGTNANKVRTPWSDGEKEVGEGSSTFYFKNLADLGNVVTLKANMEKSYIVLPTVTKNDTLCVFRENADGTGEGYVGGLNYTLNKPFDSQTLYASCYDTYPTFTLQEDTFFFTSIGSKFKKRLSSGSSITIKEFVNGTDFAQVETSENETGYVHIWLTSGLKEFLRLEEPCYPYKVFVFSESKNYWVLGSTDYFYSYQNVSADPSITAVNYQWYVDKGNGYEAIPGANSSICAFEVTSESLSWSHRLGINYRFD